MAGYGQSPVTTAPTQQQANPAYKKDENGEEILFEGVCNSRGLCYAVFWIYFQAAVISLLGMVLLIPVGIICGLMAPKNWRCYLTRTGIKYRRPIGIGCCDVSYDIPFADIEDIEVELVSNDILVRMETETANKYVSSWNRPLCGRLIGVYLTNVENGEDFVAAVKREKQARQM